MAYRILSALALALAASFPAMAQPGIPAAIAPDARYVEVNSPATFFATMVNSGDSGDTNLPLYVTNNVRRTFGQPPCNTFF